MNFKSIIKTRFATWILGIVLAVAMFATAKILIEQQRINNEIARLEQQADKVKQENERLSYLIEYFNTEDYEEKQAREKLNLKKDGEYVVSLPESTDQDEQAPVVTEELNSTKWFNYFFKHESR